MSEDATGRLKRRPAAIMFAGYTRLLPSDEANSFAGLALVRTEIIVPYVLKFGGYLIRWTTDEALIEFESGVEAARCAAALRDAVAKMNQTLPDEQRIAMRIGINFGDVIAEEGEVFGDGVNIAARLQALAKPGSVYVSETVLDQVGDEFDFGFEDLGPQNLKNIARPSYNPRPALSQRAFCSWSGVYVDAPSRARDRGVRGGDQA